MSKIMEKILASAPDDDYIIRAIVIESKGQDPIRLCDEYEDLELGGHMHRGSNISISLPKKSTNGQQNLSFGLWNAHGEALEYVDKALRNNDIVYVTLYEYLASDLDNFVTKTKPMNVKGGSFRGIQAKFDASFQDLLNSAFPRERYTDKTAPAIQYM